MNSRSLGDPPAEKREVAIDSAPRSLDEIRERELPLWNEEGGDSLKRMDSYRSRLR